MIEIEYEELLDFVNALNARAVAFARSSIDASRCQTIWQRVIASSLTSCSLKRTPR